MSQLQKPVEGPTSESVAQNIGDPIKADFSQIPVPPEGAEGEARVEKDQRVKLEAEHPLIALLTFTDPGAMSKTIPLEYPFEWGGKVFSGVTARRLSYAEVAGVYERNKAEDEVKLIEFYAAMTGLPAAVIRGMESGDAQAVIEGCYPFLPRQLRAEVS